MKQTIKSLDERLDKVEDKVSNNESYHNKEFISLFIWILFLSIFVAIFTIIWIVSSINSDNQTPTQYYNNPNSFCEHYNMSYDYYTIITDRFNTDIMVYTCVKFNDDKVIIKQEIQKVNDRWVFK